MTVPPDRGSRRGGRTVVDAVVLLTMVSTVVVHTSRAEVPDPKLLVVVLFSWLPLLLRHRLPVTVAAVTFVVEGLHMVLLPVPGDISPAAAMGYFQPVPIASMVALFEVAVRRSRRVTWWCAGCVAVGLATVGITAQPFSLFATDVVTGNLVLWATAAGVGVAMVRDRRLAEDARRLDATRSAVVAERLRIARELHDSLAHELTLVHAQVGVAEYLVGSDPQAAARALHEVGSHTRDALAELRATLGLLRHDEGEGAPDGTGTSRADGPGSPGTDLDGTALRPAPGLDRLPALLDAARAAGARIDLDTGGTPRPLGTAADHAGYRIVQEALTNAAKHAPGAGVRVTLGWTTGELVLDVANDPPPVPARPVPGSGHGLLGMRERVRSCGGWLRHGATPAGGFTVTAGLPVRDHDTTEDPR